MIYRWHATFAQADREAALWAGDTETTFYVIEDLRGGAGRFIVTDDPDTYIEPFPNINSELPYEVQGVYEPPSTHETV